MEHLGLLIAVLVALIAALLAGQALALAGFPIPDASRRIGCVDGLRGYLALLVMMHHFDLWMAKTHDGAAWGNSSLLLFHNFGPGGVALFFMTTGLVFYPRIRRGFAKVDWRATYISRLFRILPLQLVMVAVAVAISLYMARGMARGDVVGNLKALAFWISSYGEPPLFGYQDSGSINAYVLWSLWFEWIFYFFLLPLLALIRDHTRSRIPGWVIPAVLVPIGLIVEPLIQHFFKHPTLMLYLPLFACGMIGFELRENPKARRILASPAVAILSAALLIFAAISAWDPYTLPQLPAYALFFACIAAGNAFGGLFALRGSVVLGEISFGLYLIHGTVLYVLFTFILPTDLPLTTAYATLPLAAVAAVLVSAAAHIVIEKPGIALGRRLSGQRKQPPRASAERAAT